MENNPTSLTKIKSTARIEEKFKRYVSEADMLMHTLSTASDLPLIETNRCDSAHLLDRNTESFRCLAQLLISSSSLTKNRLFLFPPLEDPGIGIAFNFVEPVPENDDVGVEKYKKLCRELDIVPISRIIKSLDTDTLNLKYYGLTAKQIKALTETMKANAHVQTLILQDNWLNLDMIAMVSDMIVENTSLQHLSLRECRIGQEGAQKLGEVMSSLQSLKSLDLSFNDLGDIGLVALQDGLCNNTSLKKLNLSHNNITEDSGEALEKILLENKYIEELDLSWSGFFTAQGNRRLFNGLYNSDRIKNLNLAWNGIGIPPAMKPISRYIRKSEVLQKLDLSNNRLIGSSLRMARAAILKNTSLESLKIGNNIYSPDEAHSLLTALAAKAKHPLDVLDMENMYIKKESKPLLSKIKNLGKHVKIGGILSDYEIHGPNTHKLVFERCKYLLMKPKKVKARKDFGHFILSLPDHPLTPDEFKKELKKQKIKKLDKDLLQQLVNLFLNKKNTIDCPELVNDYMSFYPDTKLPPPKPKKAKKGKKKGKKNKVAQSEKEIQVHDLDLEEQPAENTENQEAAKPISQSKTSLGEISPSKKTLETVAATQSLTAVQKISKSVTIIVGPSIMSDSGRSRTKIPSQTDIQPQKSIIKTPLVTENAQE